MTKAELVARVVDAMKNEQEIDRHSPDPSAVIRVVFEAAAEMADAERDQYSHVPLMACSVATTAARIRRAITAANGEEI